MPSLVSDSEYEKQEKALNDKLKSLNEKSDNALIEEIVSREEKEDDQEVQIRCRISRRLLDEMLDEYEEGEMTWDEALKEFFAAMKQI